MLIINNSIHKNKSFSGVWSLTEEGSDANVLYILLRSNAFIKGANKDDLFSAGGNDIAPDSNTGQWDRNNSR